MSARTLFDLKVKCEDKSFEILLRDVEPTDTLLKVRTRLTKETSVLGTASFIFKKRNVSISKQQEERVSVNRITQEQDEMGMKIIHIQALDDHLPEITVSKEADKGGESESPRDDSFQVYSSAEIDLSEGIELQKRLFWNSRIQDFVEELKSNKCSKYEVYGIIDVEWTHKKTEILKVLVDKAVRLLERKNVSTVSVLRKSVSHEKDLTRCYEGLHKSQFNVKSSYRKIENIVQELNEKGRDTQKNKKRLRVEQDNFDKTFTELKHQQAALQKALNAFEEHSKETENTPIITDDSERDSEQDNSNKLPAYIEADDLQEMANSVKEDYVVEEMSEGEPDDDE